MSAARAPQKLRLAEIVSALSYALDMTDGQPAGHSIRCCWIGMHIGKAVGMLMMLHDVRTAGQIWRSDSTRFWPLHPEWVCVGGIEESMCAQSLFAMQ